MSTNKYRSTKLLITCILTIFSYLIGAEALLPIRATTDEALVIPDILTLFETGKLLEVGYSSGVGYQLHTTILLKITGLTPDGLQLLSPAIAGIAFGVFFTVIYYIYQQEADRFWWGFLPVIVSVVVFPGFVARTWESTHKAYTFIFVFISVYAVYKTANSQSNRIFLLLLSVFLIGIGVFNYLWGVIYAGLFAMMVFAFRSTRRSGFIATAGAGMISLVTPAISPLTKYHRAYFLAFKSRLDALIDSLTRSENSNTSPTGTTSTPTPTDTIPEPPSDTPSQTSGTSDPNLVGSSLLNETASVDSGTAVGRATETLGRINEWPTMEIAGLAFSTWYMYSLGIGIVATITAVASLLCLYLFLRRQFPTLGVITATVILFSALLGLALILAEDIATFKRIIVLPGIIGTLFFVVCLFGRSSRDWFSNRHRRILLISLTVIMLLAAGLATNRTLVNGGDSPIDVYINEKELNQVEWIDQYRTESGCYYVRQEVLTDYANKRGITGLKTFSVNPKLVDSVYESSSRDAVAISCV